MSTPGAVSPLFLASTSSSPAGLQVSRSLRFNSADSASLSRTFTSAGGSTWTFSCWIKLSASYTDGGYRKIL